MKTLSVLFMPIDLAAIYFNQDKFAIFQMCWSFIIIVQDIRFKNYKRLQLSLISNIFRFSQPVYPTIVFTLICSFLDFLYPSIEHFNIPSLMGLLTILCTGDESLSLIFFRFKLTLNVIFSESNHEIIIFMYRTFFAIKNNTCLFKCRNYDPKLLTINKINLNSNFYWHIYKDQRKINTKPTLITKILLFKYFFINNKNLQNNNLLFDEDQIKTLYDRQGYVKNYDIFKSTIEFWESYNKRYKKPKNMSWATSKKLYRFVSLHTLNYTSRIAKKYSAKFLGFKLYSFSLPATQRTRNVKPQTSNITWIEPPYSYNSVVSIVKKGFEIQNQVFKKFKTRSNFEYINGKWCHVSGNVLYNGLVLKNSKGRQKKIAKHTMQDGHFEPYNDEKTDFCFSRKHLEHRTNTRRIIQGNRRRFKTNIRIEKKKEWNPKLIKILPALASEEVMIKTYSTRTDVFRYLLSSRVSKQEMKEAIKNLRSYKPSVNSLSERAQFELGKIHKSEKYCELKDNDYCMSVTKELFDAYLSNAIELNKLELINMSFAIYDRKIKKQLNYVGSSVGSRSNWPPTKKEKKMIDKQLNMISYLKESENKVLIMRIMSVYNSL